MRTFSAGKVRIGPGEPLGLIAGPCVLEEPDTVMRIAERLVRITGRLKVPYIFKASYEKDNRGSEKNYRGPGPEGLQLLKRVRDTFGCPVLSDVHRGADAAEAAACLDVLQVPAYLCQQTELLISIGKTGRGVNVKKGQFMSPEGMAGAVGKLKSVGNENVLLTERGTSFGYNRLVSDFRAIPIMQGLGCPVVFDATHIVRLYGIPSSDPRGGEPQYVPMLVRAGVAAGANALFLETHFNPSQAWCDAASMIPLDVLEPLMEQAVELHAVASKWLP